MRQCEEACRQRATEPLTGPRFPRQGADEALAGHADDDRKFGRCEVGKVPQQRDRLWAGFGKAYTGVDGDPSGGDAGAARGTTADACDGPASCTIDLDVSRTFEQAIAR